jgi:hypothetical protein
MSKFKPGDRPLSDQEEMNRSGTVVVPPPPGPINPATGHDEGKVLSITGFKSRGIAGEAMNIMFGLTLEGVPNDSEAMIQEEFIMAQVRATLRWGTGGIYNTAEVDVLQGAQLSINAEDLDVYVRYIRDTRPWDPSTSETFPTFRVNVSCGYSNIGRNSNPARFSQLVQLQNPNDVKRIKIPKYAVSATVLPIGNTSTSIRVIGFGSLYDVDYTPVAATEGSLLTNNRYIVENAIPLYNAARFIDVVNTQESGEAFALIIFGLSL